MTLRLTVMMAETRRTSREGVPGGSRAQRGVGVRPKSRGIPGVRGGTGRENAGNVVQQAPTPPCSVPSRWPPPWLLGSQWGVSCEESGPERFPGAQDGALIPAGSLGALARPAKAAVLLWEPIPHGFIPNGSADLLLLSLAVGRTLGTPKAWEGPIDLIQHFRSRPSSQACGMTTVG